MQFIFNCYFQLQHINIFDYILSMLLTTFCVFSCMGTMVRFKATKLGDIFVTTRKGKGLASIKGNLVRIQGTRLGECLHSRRRQRDCVLYISSNVSLQASRQGKSHVTLGAQQRLMGSLVPLFVFMCSLVCLWLTIQEKVVSHQKQAKGLYPEWILWYDFRCKDWTKVQSHQRAFSEDKVSICCSGLLVDFCETQRGNISLYSEFNWADMWFKQGR